MRVPTVLLNPVLAENYLQKSMPFHGVNAGYSDLLYKPGAVAMFGISLRGYGNRFLRLGTDNSDQCLDKGDGDLFSG